jgi:putative ABC transport system substrate-binding protein
MAGAALVCGLGGIAHGRERRIVIGFLSNLAPRDSKWSLDAFRAGMAALGYEDGRNVTVQARYAEGKFERLPTLVAELIEAKPDVIVAAGPQAALALKNATASVPVVLAVITDPVATGLVTSLSHPGGNITGLAFQNGELTGKRLQLLRDAVPSARLIAVLSDTTAAPSVVATDALTAARTLGLGAKLYPVQAASDFPAALRAMHEDKCDAVIVLASPMLNANRRSLVDSIARARLPSSYEVRAFVEDGGLMSYGPSFVQMYRQAATYVDKILKGAKPSELPMEQPTKFELVVNVAAATALGITIPETLSLRADEVIQ